MAKQVAYDDHRHPATDFQGGTLCRVCGVEHGKVVTNIEHLQEDTDKQWIAIDATNRRVDAANQRVNKFFAAVLLLLLAAVVGSWLRPYEGITKNDLHDLAKEIATVRRGD